MPRPSKHVAQSRAVNTASGKRNRTYTNGDSNVDESRSELSISEPNQTVGIIDAFKELDNDLLHDFVKPSHIESPLTESDNDSNNKSCLTENEDTHGWTEQQTVLAETKYSYKSQRREIRNIFV
jgi:hypothetical protein